MTQKVIGIDLPSLAIHLGRTKTTSGEQDDVVYLTGRPVEALNDWMVAAKIESGSIFRGIGRWGTVSKRALDPQSVNAIFKQPAGMAGLGMEEFSAHGLRSGYLTEAANRGVPCQKPWNNPAIDRCNRHRVITTARRVGAAGLRGCFNEVYKGTKEVHSIKGLQDDVSRRDQCRRNARLYR